MHMVHVVYHTLWIYICNLLPKKPALKIGATALLVWKRGREYDFCRCWMHAEINISDYEEIEPWIWILSVVLLSATDVNLYLSQVFILRQLHPTSLV